MITHYGRTAHGEAVLISTFYVDQPGQPGQFARYRTMLWSRTGETVFGLTRISRDAVTIDAERLCAKAAARRIA